MSAFDGPRSRLRRWVRRTLWTVGIAIGALLLLVGALLLGLQTESGATAAARWLASVANPLPDTELTVGQASGSWVRSLRLTDVALTRTDSMDEEAVTMAHVDTLAARYHLWPLLRGRLHVERLDVAGPEVSLQQAADSTWDWGRLLPASEEPDTSAAMPVRIDRLRLTRGAFSASFYAEGRDSTARIHDLQVRARSLESAGAVAGQLDTLGVRGRLPGDTTDLRLAVRGELSASAAVLDTLQLDSPRSRVRGHGEVRFPSDPLDAVDDAALRVEADPFALRDLTLVAPALDVDPQESVRLDVEVNGSGRRLTGTADARFSGGGTVTARATGTPTTTTSSEGPPLHYQLDAEIRSLTTSLLGVSDPEENRLNATVAMDLQGRSVHALDGTADLRISDTRWVGLHTPEMALATTLRDGEASLDLQGTLNEARLQATGRARPLDEAPSADVTARVQALDLAQFVPDAGIESALSATTELRARALGTDRQTLDATVTLASSRVGMQSIRKGRIQFGFRPDRARLDAGLVFQEGQVEAVGEAALDGSEKFVLERVRLDRFNVAALAGDTTENRVTGTARAEGRGFATETMRLDASIDLRDSHYGAQQLSSLTTRVDLDQGRLTTTTDATLNGSTWALALNGRPFAATPTFELTRGRFRDLDIGPFLQDTTQSSRLHGQVRGSVQGTDLANMTVDAGLTLDTSRVNRQRIDDASIDLRLRDGALASEFALDTPSGGGRVAVAARPFAEVPTYEVTEGSFEALNVGALANAPALTTALSGSMTLSGRGLTASTLAVDADLSFVDSQINEASFPQGRLVVSTEAGRTTADGQFDVAGGEVTLSGTMDSLSTTPVYAARSTIHSVDAGALAGLDSLTAHVDSLQWTLDGRGLNLNTLTASTALSGRRIDVDRLSLDTLDVRGELLRGQLALDTMHVETNAFDGRGSGLLALTDTSAVSSFSLRADVTDLAPFREIVGAETLQLEEGSLETRIYGTSLAAQRFDGTVALEGLSYNDVRLTDAEIDFNGARGRDQWLRRFGLDGTLGYLSLPALSTEETRLRATYDGADVDLNTTVRLDPTHAVDLRAQIAPEAERTDVTLTRLNLRMDESRWSLRQETSITVNDDYQIRDLVLQSGDQRIAANGIVDLAGTQNLAITAEEVQVGAFSPLFGFSGVAGTLTGSLDLTGPSTAPELESRVDFDLRTENRDVGTLRLEANYRDLRANFDAELRHTDGSVLAAEGGYPIDLRLEAPAPVDVESRSVRLDVATEQFPVDWVDPFLDPATARNVRGRLAADVEVRGSLDAPRLAGTASLSGGGVSLPALETHYRSGVATLRLQDDQILIEKAELRSSNDGRFRAKGVINFPQLTVGEYNLTLDASNFIAIDTRAYRRAIVNGSLRLKGTTQRPVMEGAVEVRSADIFFNEALAEGAASRSAVALSEEDQLTLENRFGLRLSAADTTTFDTYEALEMDLTVRIQRNTWLRSRSNPEMNVQFTGDLDLTKARDEDAQVFGSIQVVTERSTIRQFGQEFQITEGDLTFNGDPATPYLNLAAVYEQRARQSQESEVRITLTLEGRPDDLSPTLSSDPPMDTRNILSYLATGRPADELLSGGNGGGSGGLATQVALGQASTFVENLAASELGLDVVRVQIRTSGDSYLTVGRYFTPRLFVSVEQPVTTSGLSDFRSTQYLPDLTLEYQLRDTIMLRALNTQRSLQLNLLFEYAY